MDRHRTAPSSPLPRSRRRTRFGWRAFRANEQGDWRRQAKRVRGMPDGARTIWCLSRERADSRFMVLAPASEKAGERTGENPRCSKGRRAVGPAFAVRRTARRRPGSSWRGLTVEQKQQTGAGGVLAFGGMPQTEVADLMQALGQDVLKEAAHELLAGDAADSPAVGFAMLVADGDSLIVEADDAGIGDRDE